jgi:site-specific recombinase XerD
LKSLDLYGTKIRARAGGISALKDFPALRRFRLLAITNSVQDADLAGFKDLTRVHDLRHTFNSLMQMNGVDPATMGKILGHKDIETTMIYTHQTQEHLRKSIGKIDIE